MGVIQHVYTHAVADGTATSVVRPSDWNSVHAYTMQDGVSLGGNTAGVLAAISSGTLFLAGGNNITLSQNGNSVTVSGGAAAGGANVTAANGGFAFQTLSFSNTQGVSFATSAGSAIVASVETSYAASNHSHGNPTLFLTSLGGTTASNSAGFTLSLSAGPYITTARASTDAIGLNTALTANGVAWTVNSSGLSLNIPAFLTTARGSTDAVGLATAQTNVTWTVNSAGLSFNAGGYNGTGFTSTTTAGTDVKATNNTAGLSMAVPAYLTSQSNQNVTAANGGFAFQTLSFSNAQGVSFATSAGSAIVASVETSYAASNHSHGNPTLNLTNLSGTTASASNGLTLSLSVSQATGRYYEPANGAALVANGFSQSILSFQRIYIPDYMTITRFDVLGAMTGSSGAASGGISFTGGLYTVAGSTAGLASSNSFAITWTSGSDASAGSRWGGQSGTRYRSGSAGSWAVTPGDYLFGLLVLTGTSQTAHSWSIYGASAVSLGPMADLNAALTLPYFGDGIFSAGTGALMASMHLSDFGQVGVANGLRQPWFALIGSI